jgi:hypothetical protein
LKREIWFATLTDSQTERRKDKNMHKNGFNSCHSKQVLKWEICRNFCFFFFVSSKNVGHHRRSGRKWTEANKRGALWWQMKYNRTLMRCYRWWDETFVFKLYFLNFAVIRYIVASYSSHLIDQIADAASTDEWPTVLLRTYLSQWDK